MDDIERADKDTQAYLAASLANRVNAARHGPSLSECRECGSSIPEARQKEVPGVELCVFCKGEAELRDLRRAGL